MNSEALIVNIEKLSKIKGVSKTKALTDSGAGKDLVSNVKKGQNPSIDKLERLADYFNVSVDYLLGRTEHMNCSGNIDSIITHGSDNVINNNSNNITQSAPIENDDVWATYSKLSTKDKLEVQLDILNRGHK